MKTICLFLTVGLMAAGSLSLWSQDAPTGAELFRARCGTCHGANGEGLDSAEIPAIRKTPMTVAMLSTLILEGRSGKRVHYSPIVNIDAAGAKAIAEYIKSLE